MSDDWQRVLAELDPAQAAELIVGATAPMIDNYLEGLGTIGVMAVLAVGVHDDDATVGATLRAAVRTFRHANPEVWGHMDEVCAHALVQGRELMEEDDGPQTTH